jgi:putative Mn2+ efflux pump MntP
MFFSKGVADSIDAMVVGVTIQANVHTTAEYQAYIAFAIIGLMTFLVSLIGLFAGKGGVVLCTLAILIVLEGYGIINF